MDEQFDSRQSSEHWESAEQKKLRTTDCSTLFYSVTSFVNTRRKNFQEEKRRSYPGCNLLKKTVLWSQTPKKRFRWKIYPKEKDDFLLFCFFFPLYFSAGLNLCVCVHDRECVCLYVWERGREGVCMCKGWICVCVCERERVCVSMIDRVCVYV